MRAGEQVLLRSNYRGNVRWCLPHHYAGTWDGRHVLYAQPGSKCKRMDHSLGPSYLDYWMTDGAPYDHVWERTHGLRCMREGERHTVEVHWDTAWSFLGWYVNLQAPLVVRERMFDTTDWALDIVIEPDGTWRWKDEDDFARAQELGIFDADTAARIRAEGERVIAERPWPTGWESWRPPADWGPLDLPEDWHVV